MKYKSFTMNTEAYAEWVNLFDEDISKTWLKERKDLQKSAMLLEALQKELKRVHSILNNEFIYLRCKLEQKDHSTEEKYTATSNMETLSIRNKVNENNAEIEEKSSVQQYVDEYKSPDLFRNVETNISPIIDITLSDEDATAVDRSPTLNKGRTNSKRHRLTTFNKSNSQSKKCDNYNLVKKDLFRTPKSDNDDTIIDCTPDTTKKQLKTDSKISHSRMNRKTIKKRKHTTLTQIFSNCQTSAANTKSDGRDSDETYCETSEMGITDMLDYIAMDKDDQNQSGNDSTHVEDEFSNGAFLNDSDVLSPEKKTRILKAEPVIRGLARKELTGFACEKCKNFYGKIDLSPEELQKKMDECSKHRYKYNPPDETVAGLWDLTFSASQVKEVKK